jgi:hypothetical protein
MTTGSLAAACAIALLGACSDDDNAPSDDPGGEVEDNPEGVTGSGSTIVDADVPVSNLANQPESPLEPPTT